MIAILALSLLVAWPDGETLARRFPGSPGAVTRESSISGGCEPFFQRAPGAAAILGPVFRLPPLELRPVESLGVELYWFLPLLPDGGCMLPVGHFFAREAIEA